MCESSWNIHTVSSGYVVTQVIKFRKLFAWILQIPNLSQKSEKAPLIKIELELWVVSLDY